MVSDMDAIFSCIFNLCAVRMRIAITCIVPKGYLRVFSLKKKSVSGGGFFRGKSKKEELNKQKNTILKFISISICISQELKIAIKKSHYFLL